MGEWKSAAKDRTGACNVRQIEQSLHSLFNNHRSPTLGNCKRSIEQEQEGQRLGTSVLKSFIHQSAIFNQVPREGGIATLFRV